MYKKEWTATDESQFMSKEHENKFWFVEFLSLNDEVFVINFGCIEYTDFSEDNILKYIEPFGYESISSLQKEYNADWKQIACECIFESIDNTRYFSSLLKEDCIQILKEDFGIIL